MNDFQAQQQGYEATQRVDPQMYRPPGVIVDQETDELANQSTMQRIGGPIFGGLLIAGLFVAAVFIFGGTNTSGVEVEETVGGDASSPGVTSTLSSAPTLTNPPPPPSTTVLTEGDEGDDVRRVQRELAVLGWLPLNGADGIYGPGTRAAVEAFQEAAGLPVTGVVDEFTRAAFDRLEPPEAPTTTTTTTAETTSSSSETTATTGSTTSSG